MDHRLPGSPSLEAGSPARPVTVVSAPDPDRGQALPVDELALEIIRDLVVTKEWNEYNYLNSARQDLRYQRNEPALRALAEGLGWLRSRGLIARSSSAVKAPGCKTGRRRFESCLHVSCLCLHVSRSRNTIDRVAKFSYPGSSHGVAQR